MGFGAGKTVSVRMVRMAGQLKQPVTATLSGKRQLTAHLSDSLECSGNDPMSPWHEALTSKPAALTLGTQLNGQCLVDPVPV